MKIIATSLAAISLAVANPAHGQQAADQPSPGEAEAGLNVEELMANIGEIGVRDRELFGGVVLRGQIGQDYPYVAVIGPRDFAIGEEVDLQPGEIDELRQTLAQADLGEPEHEEQWAVVQGRLDGHSVLAASGDFHPDDAGPATTSGDFDQDDFSSMLSEAGIADQEAFRGRLLQLRNATGHIIYMLAGPEGFAGGAEIELSEQQLQESAEETDEIEDIQILGNEIFLSRGSLNDLPVLVVAGPGVVQ